jgi:hypothetical protein
MGYRSDVVALMYSKEDTPESKAIIKEFIRQRINDNLTDYFDYDGWGAKFEAEQWKWYDSYADIQMLEKLFDEYQEAFCGGHGVDYDCKYAYEFIRVGESYDDIETHEAGCNQGRLCVQRSITVD